jgi:hypothetical protein
VSRRGPAAFRQRDVTAAIRGTERAGKQVYAAEVARDGTIRIIVAASAVSTPEANPWDAAGEPA